MFVTSTTMSSISSMLFQNVFAILLLFLPLIDCDVNQRIGQHEIVDISFRPFGQTEEIAISDDDEETSDRKSPDLMKLSFDAFDEGIDVLVHRSLDAELYGAKFEIHGINDSDIWNFNISYYEYNSATTNVQGYRNRYGQFEGFVMMKNGRSVYFIEPASVYYPDDPAVVSKSVVYKQNEVIMGDPQYYHGHDYYDNEGSESSSSYQPAMDNKTRSEAKNIAFKIRIITDFTLENGDEKHDTLARLYFLGKSADLLVRSTKFDSVTVRLITSAVEVVDFNQYRKITDGSPFMKRIFQSFMNNYKPLESAVIYVSHIRSNITGYANVGQLCNKFAHGVVSLVKSDGYPVSKENLKRTFHHVIGHIMGSHDDSEECSLQPYAYVMHKSAHTSGDHKRKDLVYLDRFSSCSIKGMTDFLKNKANMVSCRNKRETNPQQCGNGIREGSEECDCGPSKVCKFVDECCWSSKDENPCTLKIGANCSPKDDECCSENCAISPEGTVCGQDGDGCLVRLCDGASKDCPAKKRFVSSGEICDKKLGKCFDCANEFCERNNMTSCLCTGDDACRACCLDSRNSTCVPVKDIKAFGFEDVFLSHGSKCGEKGTCDTSGSCGVILTKTDVTISLTATKTEASTSTKPPVEEKATITLCDVWGNCSSTATTKKPTGITKIELVVYILSAIVAVLMVFVITLSLFVCTRRKTHKIPESLEPIVSS